MLCLKSLFTGRLCGNVASKTLAFPNWQECLCYSLWAHSYARGNSGWDLPTPERPTMWLMCRSFKPQEIHLTSRVTMGLETEFDRVANDLINHMKRNSQLTLYIYNSGEHANTHWYIGRITSVLRTQRVSLAAQLVKNPPAMQETLVRFLGRKVPLKKVQAT